MDLSWLTVVNKALAAAGALRSFAKYAARAIRRLFLIDQTVDGEEIQNLVAYIKMFDAYAKSMQRAGATQQEIRAAMQELLTPRLRAYLLAKGIVDASRPRADSSASMADDTQSSSADSYTQPLPPPLPQSERRTMQLAPGDAPFRKRIGDPER